jgi:hypothetical protein
MAFKNYAAYLSGEELEVFEEIVQRYRDHRVDVFRYAEAGVDRDIAIVKNFVVFTQLAPWKCRKEDFVAWSGYLRNSKKVKLSTLRLYHGAVRRFYEYLVRNTWFSALIRNKFSVTPSVICDRQVCTVQVNKVVASDATTTDAFGSDEVLVEG